MGGLSLRSCRRRHFAAFLLLAGLLFGDSVPAAIHVLPGQLVVAPSAKGGKGAGIDLTIRSSTLVPAPARLVIYVPDGYRVRTSLAAGAVIGGAGVVYVRAARPSAVRYVTGRVKQGNRGRLSQSPSAQACAPGAHLAVWVVNLKTQPVASVLRIYVQRTLPAERALGAFKLTACPPSPYGTTARAGVRPRIRLVQIALSFRSRRPVFTRPVAAGTYMWRLLVTPYSVDGSAPNETGTFEARARVEQPHVLNLHVVYLRKARALLMSGRLLARGKPRPGVRIRFYAAHSTGTTRFGNTRTRADGRYSLRRRLWLRRDPRVLYFGAGADAVKAPCSAPSVAPAGCVDENLSPPAFAAVTVRLPSASRG
jgi:hypothetical protein